MAAGHRSRGAGRGPVDLRPARIRRVQYPGAWRGYVHLRAQGDGFADEL